MLRAVGVYPRLPTYRYESHYKISLRVSNTSEAARRKAGAAPMRGPGCENSTRHDFYDTRTSIFFGCASGSFWIVTCSTPLVSSAVIVSGSTVSGSDTLRETLP